MRSYEAYSPNVVEEEFSEGLIAPVQHPCPLAEVVDLRGLSSILGAQETDGQHRHPEHSGIDVDALLNPHPWRRLVCLHLANLQARQNAKHDEREDGPVRVIPEPLSE